MTTFDIDRINKTAARLRLATGYGADAEDSQPPEDGFGTSMILPMDMDDDKRDISVPVLSLDELRAAAGGIRWLCKHIIPADSVGMLYGASGSFKSFIALDLALHVAHGMQWLGRKTTAGQVVYLAAEGGAGLWRRIDAWHRTHGADAAQAAMMVIPVAIDLGESARSVVDALSARGVSPDLIIINTMSQTYSGEENSANEVAAYLREIGTHFRARWRCCVLIVHHVGHAATERPRGSSAITANLDFAYGCHRDGDQRSAIIECHKQKDGEKPEEVTFRLAREELGLDEDGEMTSSLVACRVINSEDMVDLMRSEKHAGRAGNNSTLIDVAKDGMTEKELRDAFYAAYPGSDNPDSRKKAFQRASKWAQQAGVLLVTSGRVTILRAV